MPDLRAPGGLTAPRILGVVNVTEDSFSDGGRFLDPAAAIAHARRLVADGAAVVDVGAASSHPDARPVDPDEEIRRLAPVVDALVGEGIPVSVDSFQPAVQRWALGRGVAWLNDVRGFGDVAVHRDLAAASCTLVVMHAVPRGAPVPEPPALVARIVAFFERRLATLAHAGVARRRVVLDPGMGFFLSRRPEHSIAVLRALPALRAHFGLPVLVGVSRKGFLGALTGRDVHERGAATLAAELWAARQGVDWIRTHDVRALADALRVTAALAG